MLDISSFWPNFVTIFWTTNGRKTVKRALIDNSETRCTTCYRAYLKPYDETLPAPLPDFRSNAFRVFEKTELDYFGPLTILPFAGATKPIKAYGALFDCLTFRAIHLELVTSQSAPECLGAFKRFISRRGMPTLMLSDNAPCFYATQKLYEMNSQETIQNGGSSP